MTIHISVASRLARIAGCSGVLGFMAPHATTPALGASADSRQAVPVLAFPGAEGFGAYAIGGRGGRVIAVTNLTDDGPGSLRAAVRAKGPRTVVFRISGMIDLLAPLEIKEPFITIAGQTAPGDGICLKTQYLRIEETHDVIIRHLRIRPGAGAGRDASDALQIYRSQNVIVDHCSLSWTVDETIDIADEWRPPYSGPNTDNVTVQWCIISESLRKAGHQKGEHGYAALISALRDADITLHHNLISHHQSRMPRPGGRRGFAGLRLEFRNNVIYDWGKPAPGYSSDSDTAAAVSLTYLGNYLKPGPSTPAAGLRVAFNAAASTAVYAAGNRLVGFAEADSNNSVLIKGGRRLDAPITAPAGKLVAASDAYSRVMSEAGATRPRRDPVDVRIVRQAENNTGGIIDSPSEVGGWPNYQSALAEPDTDNDGMPDAWEKTHGFDPNIAADGNADPDGDGFTNLEEFLNGTHPAKRD